MSRSRPLATSAPDADDRVYWTIALGGVLLALLLRASLASFPSGDFTQFTRDWYEAIGRQGIVAFLGSGITNYAPLYTYAMVVAHVLFGWVEPVVAIKLIGLPFDFACAYFTARLVGLAHPGRFLGLIAFLCVLFLPTLVINGSMWGQADSIYTAGLLACVYYLACERPWAACVALGLAFCVKLQALFLWPLLLLLWMERRLSPMALLLVPGMYVASCLPAWVCGRPLVQLLTVYLNQATYYPRLTSNAPHIYQWFPASMYEMMVPAGILFGVASGGLLAVAVWRARTSWTPARWIQLATLSLLLVPYVTPKMHERYFFPADVMSVALAFVCPRLAWVPIAVGAISFFSYAPFLLRTSVLPLPLLAIAMGVVVLVVSLTVGREIAAERSATRAS